jgi:hypothetical protein
LQKGSVSIIVFSTPEMIENGNINMYPFAVYILKAYCLCDFNTLLYLCDFNTVCDLTVKLNVIFERNLVHS